MRGRIPGLPLTHNGRAPNQRPAPGTRARSGACDVLSKWEVHELQVAATPGNRTADTGVPGIAECAE